MIRGEFILEKPTFSQAALKLAAQIVAAVDAKPAPVARTKPDRSVLGTAVVAPVAEPSQFERLSAALTERKNEPGYKQVAAFVASAQVSAGEPELSAARTTAVMQGLRAITGRKKAPAAVAVPA